MQMPMAVLHLVSAVVQISGAAARLVAPRHQHLRAAAGRQHVPLGQRRGGRCEGPGCRRVSDSTQAHRLRTSLLFPPYTPTSLSCNISFKTLALQTGTRRSLAPSAFPPRPLHPQGRTHSHSQVPAHTSQGRCHCGNHPMFGRTANVRQRHSIH